MSKKKSIILLAVLLIITLGAAVLYLGNREGVEEGNLKITTAEDGFMINTEEFELEQVTGTRINGKGEEKPVDGMGILVKDILEANEISEYTKVTVVSDDAYSAELSAEEIAEAGKAYLLYEEEELRLVVFGDENSKRSVSNVVEIVVE